MLELFQRVVSNPNAQRMPGEFDYIKGIYLRELLGIQDYYQNRVYATRNQHILVRLLTHIDTPHHYDLDRFIESTRARAPYIAKAFKFTSEIDKGIIHNGNFYGHSNPEILIYEDSYFDAVYAEKNWKRISAINTIWHPRSDLGFMLGNGRVSSTDTGLSVISVNIPMLAVQFRCFMKEQMIRQSSGIGGVLGITHFVHMYVLPNMLYRHTDIVLFNRIIRLFYGIEMGEAKFKHPFPIVNYENKLDNLLVKIIDDYVGRNMSYEWLLAALPAFSSADSREALEMPDIGPTRQVWWAMVVSRLVPMKFLIDLGGEKSIRYNRHYINRMQRDIKRLRRDNVLSDVMSDDMYYNYNVMMEDLLSI